MPERPKSDKSDKPLLSRLKKLQTDKKDDDYQPEMPPIDGGYLVAYLFEIGPTMTAGMGSGPITHGEIESWQRITGVELNPWEARTLRRLSVDYLVESQKATDIKSEAPWTESEDVIPAHKDTSTRDAIRALAVL